MPTRRVGVAVSGDGPSVDGAHRIKLSNLVSLCRTHHRRVHEQGWRIHITDGVAVVEPPP